MLMNGYFMFVCIGNFLYRELFFLRKIPQKNTPKKYPKYLCGSIEHILIPRTITVTIHIPMIEKQQPYITIHQLVIYWCYILVVYQLGYFSQKKSSLYKKLPIPNHKKLEYILFCIWGIFLKKKGCVPIRGRRKAKVLGPFQHRNDKTNDISIVIV